MKTAKKPKAQRSQEDSVTRTLSLREDFIKAINDSYKLLSTARDLSPDNEAVAKSIMNLRQILTECVSPEMTKFLLTAPELKEARKNLPELCGRAECETEKHWARTLLAQPACDITEFLYYPKYKALCSGEFDLFRQYSFNRISFLGSGAMPMTAFMLAHMHPNVPIVCVDSDEEACNLSRQLCEKLGLQNRMTILHMKAIDYIPVKNELVFCAALLEGKKEIYEHLDKYSSALIVRDAEGPYQFLYKAAEVPKAHFRQVAKTELNTRRDATSRFYIHNTGQRPG